MVVIIWKANEDYWNLNNINTEKVVFDGILKLIIPKPDVTEIDIGIDVYGAWKAWSKLRDNLKFTQAMRSTGGDPTTSGNTLGATYFMVNGWKILVNAGIRFIGNVFADDFPVSITQEVFATLASAQLASSERSNIIDKPASEFTDIDRTNLAQIKRNAALIPASL